MEVNLKGTAEEIKKLLGVKLSNGGRPKGRKNRKKK